jgi:hypothetical protein
MSTGINPVPGILPGEQVEASRQSTSFQVGDFLFIAMLRDGSIKCIEELQ